MLRGTDYKPYTAVGVTERPFPQFYATRRGVRRTGRDGAAAAAVCRNAARGGRM
jgi:hypothetical protein